MVATSRVYRQFRAAVSWGMLSGLILIAAAAPVRGQTPSPAVCAAVIEHQPRPDVAYRPGVDVNGRPVRPADLPGAPTVALPPVIKIPLTRILASQLGVPVTGVASAGAFGAEAQLGVLEIRLADGQVSYNGQPLQDEQQRRLAAICAGR